MGYSVQDNLLRLLLCCCLRLLRPSLGMPTVQTLGEITMRRLNWTREGVSGYTPSEPLYVVLHDILKFQCEERSTDFVYLLREDAYKNVSNACSSSGIVEESTLSSLCRPEPIADCRQTQPEKRVDGANATASSCYIASFIPGMSYYLTSFPSSGDTSRCLFALPLKVCPLYDSDCPPSGTPSTPSPSPSITTFVSSTPPPTAGLSPGSGSGFLPSAPVPTTTSLPTPSMVPTLTTTTTDSAWGVHSTLTIAVCLCSLLVSLSSQ